MPEWFYTQQLLHDQWPSRDMLAASLLGLDWKMRDVSAHPVAVHGSATSDLALKEALRFGREQHAARRLAHVIDDMLGLGALKTPHQMVDCQAELRKAGAQLLADAAAEARQDGIEAETALLRVDGAAAHNGSRGLAGRPIVIGTHVRRGFRRVLLGPWQRDSCAW